MGRDENYKHGCRNGQWKSFDRVLVYLNSIDTDGKTGNEIKKEIYRSVMEMRPENF